jgi:hypothetical protein
LSRIDSPAAEQQKGMEPEPESCHVETSDTAGCTSSCSSSITRHTLFLRNRTRPKEVGHAILCGKNQFWNALVSPHWFWHSNSLMTNNIRSILIHNTFQSNRINYFN